MDVNPALSGNGTHPGRTGRRSRVAVLLLLSLPFLGMLSFLYEAQARQSERYADAREVLAVFAAGEQALRALAPMRSLSRPATVATPDEAVAQAYEQAIADAKTAMQPLVALSRQRADSLPSLRPLVEQLAEEAANLGETGFGSEDVELGPVGRAGDAIDKVNRLLAATLYSAGISGAAEGGVVEMLQVVPNTLGPLGDGVGIAHALSLPRESDQSGVFAAEMKAQDDAWNSATETLETLEVQLAGMGGLAEQDAHGAWLQRLQDVHAFLDDIEAHYILDSSGMSWDEVWNGGSQAQTAISDVAKGLIGTASAEVEQARTAAWRTTLSLGGLILGAYVLAMLMTVQILRARESALEKRALELEVEGRRVRERELLQLNTLAEALMGCESAASLCSTFATHAESMFQGSRGVVALVSPRHDLLSGMAGWGGAQPEDQPLASCQAVRTGLVTLSSGPGEGCAHGARDQHTATACIPLLVKARSLGSLWLAADRERIDGYVRLATSASEVLRLSLSNMQLRDTLHDQAIRDPLTGLYNRRQLQEEFRRELSIHARTGEARAVVILDIDHFKKINDRYGHDAGDQVLTAFADYLSRHVRGGDVCFRFGGEEFVILVRGDVQGAMACADNIRTGFLKKPFVFAGDTLPVTFSAGVAQLASAEESLDHLLQRADAALYRAKANGRNRVEVAAADGSQPVAETG